jgi:hypothetical protein
MLDELKEWSINFVKHRDMFNKKLVDFKVLQDMIEFEFKDKKHLYIILPDLGDGLKERVKDGFITIVCLNKKNNLDYVIKNWNMFIKNKKLNLIFVNPHINDKWILNPSVHDMVSDHESLTQGLKTLFEGVQEVR